MATMMSITETDVLARIIAQHHEGIGLPALAEVYTRETGEPMARRTLQRRLKALVDDGLIRMEGAARAVKYHSARRIPIVSEPMVPFTSRDSSTDGEDVRRLIRRPIIERTPVGYNPEFLLDYQPGRNWYLSEDQREKLHELGRTTVGYMPAGTFARHTLDRLLIDLSWASSRLEGNTYSRLDTKNLIEFGQHAEGADLTEARMILNHKHAIELLVDSADEIGFNRYTFLNLHAVLSEDLLESRADEGRLRTTLVQISGSVFMPPGVPQLLEEQFDLLLQKAEAILDPFEQAFFVMVHLPYLQPFIDANKRVSRLAANIPLIRANLIPLSFIDVPNETYVEAILGVYELNRVELLRDLFLWAYERSAAQYRVVRQTMKEPDPFRIRYRDEMVRVVEAIVQAGQPPQESVVREAARGVVPGPDMQRFVEMTFTEMVHLHEGNIARYRLRPSEFRAWRALWPPAK